MSSKVFKERWVNFFGDAKDGGGKFMYLSGDDIDKGTGFIATDEVAKGVSKGAKITVKVTGKSGKNYVIGKVRIDAEARSGGGGGSRGRAYGGGGGAPRKSDPAVQQSIVMQHSQTVAAQLLGPGADLSKVLQTACVLFAQAYGPGLEAAVAAAETMDVDATADDFGDEPSTESEVDDDDDFDDDFDE